MHRAFHVFAVTSDVCFEKCTKCSDCFGLGKNEIKFFIQNKVFCKNTHQLSIRRADSRICVIPWTAKDSKRAAEFLLDYISEERAPCRIKKKTRHDTRVASSGSIRFEVEKVKIQKERELGLGGGSGGGGKKSPCSYKKHWKPLQQEGSL